jgi:hypothetical protein
MQHKTESKDCLIDNENCENIRTNSTPITKSRRNSIHLQPEDLDLYYIEGFEGGKQSNNIFARHKILVSLVLVFLAISSVVAIIVIKQGGVKKSGILLPQSGSWKGYYLYHEVRHDFQMNLNFWKNGSLSGSGKNVGIKDVLDITGLWNSQGIRFGEYNKSAHDVKYTGRAHFNDLTNLDGRWSNNQLDVSFHMSYDKS